MVFIEAECTCCGANLEIENRSDCFGIKFGVQPCQSCLNQEYEYGKRDIEEEAYDEGQKDGMREGKSIGYEDGFAAGHSEGYQDGYAEGEEYGYNKCARENDL